MTPRDALPDEPGAAERLEDALDYARKFMEGWKDRPTLKWLTLPERYAEGRLHLLVRILWRGSDSPVELPAIFHGHEFAGGYEVHESRLSRGFFFSPHSGFQYSGTRLHGEVDLPSLIPRAGPGIGGLPPEDIQGRPALLIASPAIAPHMSLMFSLARSTLTQLLVAQLMGSRLMRLATRLRKFRLWHIDDAAGQVAHFLERRLLRRNSLRRGFGILFHTLAFRRFGPRLKCGLERASRRGWGEVCPDQIAIGQPLAQQGIYHRNEPLPVAGPAIVAPEHLLAQVARDVEGVHADVGPANGPLQQAPEILDAVRVDPADAVLALGTLQNTKDGARSPVVATSRIAGHQPTPLRYTHVLELPTQERFVNLSCAAQGVATSMRHRGPDAPQH